MLNNREYFIGSLFLNPRQRRFHCGRVRRRRLKKSHNLKKKLKIKIYYFKQSNFFFEFSDNCRIYDLVKTSTMMRGASSRTGAPRCPCTLLRVVLVVTILCIASLGFLLEFSTSANNKLPTSISGAASASNKDDNPNSIFAMEATTTTRESVPTDPPPPETFESYEEHRASCDKVYGHEWLKTMRNTHTELCQTGPARLDAYRSHVMNESPYFLLDFHNVVVDHGRIGPPHPETGVEQDEYFRLSPGAIRVPCSPAPGALTNNLAESVLGSDQFTGGDWLRSVVDFLSATEIVEPSPFPYDECDAVVEEPTMAVKRFEYANLYHQSTDYINVEIARHLLDIDNQSIALELFDGHRRSELDEFWERVFDAAESKPTTETPHKHLSRMNSRLRRRIVNRICYRRLILVSPGYASRSFAMHTSSDPCAVPSPFYASLRARFLRGFRITEAQAKADPSRCLIVARRDYQAHPRNVEGKVTRKFADEQMLVRAAANAGMQCSVIDLARMPVETQVQRISIAPILMGVHGAGLSYAFLLPPTGILIEARVDYFAHFENLAGYSGRRYIGFESFGSHEQSTVEIDEEALTKVFRQAISMQHEKYL